MKKSRAVLFACLAVAVFACAAADIEVGHAMPCNIFETGSKVEIPLTIVNRSGSGTKVRFEIRDYRGKLLWEKEEKLTGRKLELRLSPGIAERGYYELETTVLSSSGEVVKKQRNSFGVADFSYRSAAEARAGGYRFGMKLWLISEIWWNRKLSWDPGKITDMCCKLGLQWTRAQLGQVEHMDTLELIRNHPVNVVLKVEMYPESMIDRARYPGISDFSKVKGGVKALLPVKEQYQSYLEKLLEQVPPEQNVYEIWNEPWQWNTMSAEDFAQLADWAAETIVSLRPDAVVGSNIYGTVNDYDKRVIRAGKLRNQSMVAIHPYCTRTTEYRGFRQILRNYRDYIGEETGKKVDFYATEFGWSTAPEADKAVSEVQQARNSVREAFELYAADVKTLIPHTMATREQNPKDREDFFGFFRLNSEPKPALIAFSNAARMIDGSEYIGENSFGEGIGAMRFRKKDVETLVLWTEDREIPLTFDAGVPELTLVDIMGGRRQLKTDRGTVSLTLSGDPLYLVGVAPSPPGKLIAPEDEPVLDRWRPRRVTGSVAAVNQLPATAEPEAYGEKPLFRLDATNACAASLRSYWSRTGHEMAILFDVNDKAIVTSGPGGKGAGDRILFDLCLRPGRQFDQAGIYDYRFIVTPPSGSSPAKLRIENVRFDKPQEFEAGRSLPGIRWSCAATPQGYRAELRFEGKALGVETPGRYPVSYRVILYNRDRSDVDEWAKYHTRISTQSDKLNFNELNLVD